MGCRLCRESFRLVACIALIALAPVAGGQEAPGPLAPALPGEAVVIGRTERHLRLVIPKDPTLAMILSVGTPGMGQIYVGRWQRGLGFLGGVAASLVAVGLATDGMSLTVADYDKLDRGGNGDETVQVAEYRRWEKDPMRDFGDISTNRKAIILGGLAMAMTLYAWNIYDARECALDHNRKLYADLTGTNLSFGVNPRGAPEARVSLAF